MLYNQTKPKFPFFFNCTNAIEMVSSEAPEKFML